MPTPAQPPDQSTHRSAKKALRAQVRTARRERTRADSEVAAASIARHALAWEAVRRSETVAAYASVDREPGTAALLDALHAAGKRILLPVLRADLDLDWALYEGDLVKTSRGLLEPPGPTLGVGAVGEVDVVLAPGVAVSVLGDRLGHGGGCYDRALARVAASVPIAVVLHEDETRRDVPTEPHDRRVTHVVTPAGLTSFDVSS